MSPKVVVWVAWVSLLGYAIYRIVDYGLVQIPPFVAWLMLIVSVVVVAIAVLGVGKALARSGGGASSSGPSLLDGAVALVAAGVAVSLALALSWHFIGAGTPSTSIADVTDSTQFNALLSYARGLTYEATAHGMADSAFLTDTVHGVQPPVKAWIAPARGANFVSYHSLSGSGPGRGRVVARVTVDTTGGGGGYQLLNFPAGVSYIWVDKLVLHQGTGTFRALIIPDQQGGKVRQFPKKATFVYFHSPGFANYPTARWVLQHSQCVNPGCSNGCCRVCPS